MVIHIFLVDSEIIFRLLKEFKLAQINYKNHTLATLGVVDCRAANTM